MIAATRPSETTHTSTDALGAFGGRYKGEHGPPVPGGRGGLHPPPRGRCRREDGPGLGGGGGCCRPSPLRCAPRSATQPGSVSPRPTAAPGGGGSAAPRGRIGGSRRRGAPGTRQTRDRAAGTATPGTSGKDGDLSALRDGPGTQPHPAAPGQSTGADPRERGRRAPARRGLTGTGTPCPARRPRRLQLPGHPGRAGNEWDPVSAGRSWPALPPGRLVPRTAAIRADRPALSCSRARPCVLLSPPQAHAAFGKKSNLKI